MLARRRPRGCISVMDLQPIGSAAGELANLPWLLLLNALGAESVSLGQFCVPQFDYRRLCDMIEQFAHRFRNSNGANLRVERLRDRRIVLVSDGLAGDNRPTVLIRTGLTGLDWPGLYGVLLWIRNLLRPVPYPCRYAPALLRARRIVWVPVADPQRWAMPALSPSCQADPADSELIRRYSPLAAVIDVTATSRHHLGVLIPRQGPRYRKYAMSLRTLARQLAPHGMVHVAPPAGGSWSDRTSLSLRRVSLEPELSCCSRLLQDPYYRAAQAARAELIRVELPAAGEISSSHSIWLTDRAAAIVEHLVGLQIGLVAVNHHATTRRVAIAVSVPRGGHLSLTGSDGGQCMARRLRPGLRRIVRAVMPPGATLIVRSDDARTG